MKVYGYFLCILFIIAHSSIFSYTAQAEELKDTARYHLDAQTLEKGYPVVSTDRQFTLAIVPGILSQESDVSLTTLFASKAMARSYEFTITSSGSNPLLKKSLIALFDVSDEPRRRYFRMYYYHPGSSVWLSLHSRFNTSRQELISDRIDFSEGIIGIAGGDDPLPDRIVESLPLTSKDSEENPSSGDVATFTIVFGSDILTRGYTIRFQEVTLALPPLALRAPSEVVVAWNKEEQLLDYNFRALDGGRAPLAPGALLTIKLSAEKNGTAAKKLVFWDNRVKQWRELPSSYNDEGAVVTAKTPFHFGKYKVVEDEDVYRGEASWFKDSLISKTRMAGASNDFPLGTNVIVTNPENGKQVVVEILSTGPYVEGRIIDLTYSAYKQIANPRGGVVRVRLEKIKKQ